MSVATSSLPTLTSGVQGELLKISMTALLPSSHTSVTPSSQLAKRAQMANMPKRVLLFMGLVLWAQK